MRERKDTFLFLITKIITGVIGIVSISLQTKYLSTTDVGDYSLINGVVSALVSVLIGWIGSSALRYYYSYKKDKPEEFYTTIFIDWIAMFLVSALIMVVVGFASNLPIKNHLVFTLLFLLFASFFEIMEKMMRASKHTFIYCVLLIVESAINVAFILSFHSIITSGVDLLLILRIINASLFVIASFISLKFYKYIKFQKFSFKLNKTFFKYGFPMVGIWGVGWLLSYSDRYIINLYLTSSQVGLYDVAYNFSERTIGVVVAAFGLAFFPMLIRVWKDRGKDATIDTLQQSLNSYFLLAIPMCVGLTFLSSNLYGTILDVSFKEAYIVIPITCFGFLISGVNNFLYKVWQLEEKTAKVLIVTAIAVAVNIGLNFALIPIYGYIVASITTTVSYLVAFIITFTIVRIKYKIKIDFNRLIQIIFSCAVMSAFLFFFKDHVTNVWRLVLVIIVGMLAYFVSMLAIGGLKEEIELLRKRFSKKK